MTTATCTSKHHLGKKEVDICMFGKDKNRKTGRHPHCKKCRSIARKEWYDRDSRAILDRAQERYYDNHEQNKHVANIRTKVYKQRRGISWALLMSVKPRAKKRNIEFDLTEDDIIVPKTCPILGIPLEQIVGPRGDNYPTVDRIDNSKGYTKDNIQIISWRANNLKGTATLEELIKLGEYANQVVNGSS